VQLQFQVRRPAPGETDSSPRPQSIWKAAAVRISTTLPSPGPKLSGSEQALRFRPQRQMLRYNATRFFCPNFADLRLAKLTRSLAPTLLSSCLAPTASVPDATGLPFLNVRLHRPVILSQRKLPPREELAFAIASQLVYNKNSRPAAFQQAAESVLWLLRVRRYSQRLGSFQKGVQI
jgi:hypothetical protein